ncbi:MAG: beta-lactamase family protein [Candidatus Hydrogenedentes bacterium]|nr:beta-lactamase family protein [Candidatus Hydrogenedentota bacterium]
MASVRAMAIGLVGGSLLSVSTVSPATGGNQEHIVRTADVDPKVAAIVEKYQASIPRMMDEQKVPGLAIALVFGGQLIWAEGFGVTDTTSKRPVTPDTTFSVQSISNSYTATAVMAAVAEGRLALDEPITTYLPSFTVHSRFEADPQKKITLRLLLSHRAGFTHEAPVGNNHDDDTRSFAAHIESISDTWLKFPVGQRYSYSNLGIDLAGHILEVVYRQPYAKVMAQKVFRPLGLRATTVDQDAVEQLKTRAIGHTKDHDRVPVRIAMVPAGGVYTNVRDMTRFMQFHLNGGTVGRKRVISKNVLDGMYEPCCGDEGSSYALGIAVGESRFGDTTVVSLGHSGGGLGFKSDMYWFSKLGVGVAILTNSDSHQLQGTLYSALSQEIFEAFLGKKASTANRPEKSRTPVSVDASRARQLSGLFVGPPDIELAVRDSQLGWLRQSKFYPVTFLSADEIEVKLPSMVMTLRFHSDGQRDPAWADCTVEVGAMRISGTLAYNGSPYDPVGPDEAGWGGHLGDYAMPQWGKVVDTVNLHVENGYLYFGEFRVVDEYQPGLFFLSDGEALDLRRQPPTFRNIALIRK